ncbi:MAG: class I SAM-dependent methyltransferase [Pseudomonadota bacterium]
MDYITALDLIHDILKPATYVEIGCREGRSLTLARCPSLAIDPDFEIRMGLSSPTRIFKQTSDEFFASEDLRALLGGPVDLAFIDGMHQAEFALRDFLNLEMHARDDSVILVDDILPEEMSWTTRTRQTPLWTGDVYKVIPFLRLHRPELDIRVFDIEMKGLAVISGLNPNDRQIQKNLPKHENDLAGDAKAYSSIDELRQALSPEPVAQLKDHLISLAGKRVRTGLSRFLRRR